MLSAAAIPLAAYNLWPFVRGTVAVCLFGRHKRSFVVESEF